MTVTHTPGPWRVNSDSGGIRVSTVEGLTVARVVADPNRSLASAGANAVLLAAAPQLKAVITQLMTEAQLDTKPRELEGLTVRELLTALGRGR